MFHEGERHRMDSETLEEGLYKKFGELQIAREDKSPAMFDEIAKSIEVRLIAVPGAHNELMEVKKAMRGILYREKEKILQEASNSIDVINRQKYLNQENYEVEWEFRDIYEEQIMWVMQKYQLVSMFNPMYGTLVSLKGSQAEQIEEYPEEQEDIEMPQKTPHLSIRM